MRYVTPTGLAEKVFAASVDQRRARIAAKWPIGPAGLALPFPGSVYRKTVDGALLAGLVEQASSAIRRDAAPEVAARRVGEVLAADLRALYPSADMAVLKRYAFAYDCRTVVIDFEPVEPVERITLPEPVAVVSGRPSYVVALPGARQIANEHRLTMPAEAVAYFQRIIEARRIVRQEIKPVLREPGQFACREKRAPMWKEIESVWPRFGAWMAAQREGVEP